MSHYIIEIVSGHKSILVQVSFVEGGLNIFVAQILPEILGHLLQVVPREFPLTQK